MNMPQIPSESLEENFRTDSQIEFDHLFENEKDNMSVLELLTTNSPQRATSNESDLVDTDDGNSWEHSTNS